MSCPDTKTNHFILWNGCNCCGPFLSWSINSISIDHFLLRQFFSKILSYFLGLVGNFQQQFVLLCVEARLEARFRKVTNYSIWLRWGAIWWKVLRSWIRSTTYRKGPFLSSHYCPAQTFRHRKLKFCCEILFIIRTLWHFMR